jgi:hypothetical protein
LPLLFCKKKKDRIWEKVNFRFLRRRDPDKIIVLQHAAPVEKESKGKPKFPASFCFTLIAVYETNFTNNISAMSNRFN